MRLKFRDLDSPTSSSLQRYSDRQCGSVQVPPASGPEKTSVREPHNQHAVSDAAGISDTSFSAHFCRITHLADRRLDRLAKRDIQHNGPNSVCMGIHELPPGGSSFSPHRLWPQTGSTLDKQPSPTADVIDRSHGVDDGQRFLQNEWSFQQSLCSEVPMFKTEKSATAIQTNLAAIFVSMELSRSTWLITTLLPGNGEKMSKYSIAAGNMAELFALFWKLQERSRARTGQAWPIITIQEAGLDGFWIHRALVKEDIESHIVDAASIATPRKRRHVKTDRVDGEKLLRVLMAYKRGEPRVCSMVRDISREDEDRRRIGRERKALMVERVAHVNRIKGLLFSQSITDYEPLHKNRRQRLEELRTGDGQILPSHMKAQILRELDRLELVISQIGTIEDERDALIAAQTTDSIKPSPVMMLLGIKGIGAEFANILWSEGLFRQFDNRRQVAAYAGLVPTPWQSGSVNRVQGVSKAGNPGLRATLIQLSWLWLRHQPDATLAKWFRARVERNGGRMKKRPLSRWHASCWWRFGNT